MARKDLIEALQELEKRRRAPGDGVVPAQPEGQAESSPEAQAVPASSDDAAPAAPRLERVTEPPRDEPPRPVHERGAGLPPGFAVLGQPLVLAVVMLAFAVGFLIGGRSRSVQATPADTSRALSTLPPISADDAAAAPADEDSLKNWLNKFTVQAITYDNTERGQAFARDTVRHFRAGGLPAHEPLPIAGGRALVVLVGAAPERDDLQRLRDEVRAMTAPNGQAGQFSTAEVYPISDYLPD